MSESGAMVEMAINKNLDIDKLERVIAMHREIKKEQSKENFDIHFSEMQREFKPFVRSQKGDKGKHRDHCLCWQCGLFCPWDTKLNCTIANILYSLCVIFNTVTPVWECLKYHQATEEQQKRIDEFENK